MEYFLTFIEGIASFISPCILPLIPLYISYFAGSNSKKSNLVKNSIAFVMGFSVIFVLIAIAVNSIGILISPYIKYLKILFGLLIIILGLSYMELIKFNMFIKFKKFNFQINELNFVKSFIFGMLFSISISPCVGTFLASALLLIATKSNIIKGIILILLYCLGLGVPFIISSILIDKLKSVFNIIKENYRVIKIISGFILIGMGIYLIFIGSFRFKF